MSGVFFPSEMWMKPTCLWPVLWALCNMTSFQTSKRDIWLFNYTHHIFCTNAAIGRCNLHLVANVGSHRCGPIAICFSVSPSFGQVSSTTSHCWSRLVISRAWFFQELRVVKLREVLKVQKSLVKTTLLDSNSCTYVSCLSLSLKRIPSGSLDATRWSLGKISPEGNLFGSPGVPGNPRWQAFKASRMLKMKQNHIYIYIYTYLTIMCICMFIYT